MPDSPSLLYIIGSPRSGTTMLQILLASHPQVASTVEQTLFQHYAEPWLRGWEVEVDCIENRGWKLGLPILWKKEDLEAVLRDFLARVYARVHENKPEATHLLDKHPGYSLHVRTIKALVPNAKFIHMIRDGRDVACSMRAVHGKMGFTTASISEAGEKWCTFVRGARQAAEFGEDYLEIRYEEFLEGKAGTYARVLDFCGLSHTREWIEATLAANTFEKMKERGASPDPKVKLSEKRYHRGSAGGWREEFTSWDAYRFERAAGTLLRELGYAGQEWWIENDLDRIVQPLRHAFEIRRRHWLPFLQNARALVLGPRQS